MGNLCCGDDGGAAETNLPLMRTRTERMTLTTPAISTAVHLNGRCNVRLVATTTDKERTMEINWFIPEEKIAFDLTLESLVKKRVTATNALSVTHWKSKEGPFAAEGEFPGGDYYVSCRSSSIARDKNVDVHVTLTITPIRAGDKSPKAAYNQK